ncbi:hypothetical protein J4225_01740 [Candidatus Pacearchaeota archaeon]|nr:hypothetical protein [Candidatus Pacearchaeota archaeon]
MDIEDKRGEGVIVKKRGLNGLVLKVRPGNFLFKIQFPSLSIREIKGTYLLIKSDFSEDEVWFPGRIAKKFEGENAIYSLEYREIKGGKWRQQWLYQLRIFEGLLNSKSFDKKIEL